MWRVQWNHNGGVLAEKYVCREVLLDLVGINFRNYGISIDPVIAGDVSDVGYVPFEQPPEAAEPQH